MATIDTHPESSFLRIIKDLRDDTTTLFRQEVALAKREMASKASTYAKNGVFIAVAAVVGLYAILFLFLSLNNLIQVGLGAAGLSDAISTWLAPLILAVLIGAGAAVLALKAIKAIGKEKPLPEKTLDSIKEDKDWIKAKVKG